jgi:predicted ATPase/DNA-binding CsgD family transcriptional regulator
MGAPNPIVQVVPVPQMTSATPSPPLAPPPLFVVPQPAPESTSARLVPPPTPFIGREDEVTGLVALLRRPEVRLVTLTGPGGIGKTRLALHVLEVVDVDYPGGVAGVALAPIADPDHVVPAIAAAFGVREGADRELRDDLVETLWNRRCLLLLDNCEHVVAAAPELAALLVACPDLTILATSRESLRITGEREVPVPPLSVESRVERRENERLSLDSRLSSLDSAAVRLFVERAQAVRPDFELSAENEPVVVQICRRLDGLPLAIELAAARLKILSPKALLARLDRRLPLLTRGARDLPARLLTMRDAIAWSYDLLSPEEQALFRRLAIFAGGCTLEAAAVVAAGGDEFAALDGITSLTDKNLVRADPGPGGDAVAARYDMLETVREFGLEQLATSGEEEEVRARHAAWCLAFARATFEATTSPAWGDWLRRFDVELPNLRVALGGAISRGDGETAFGLIGWLGRLFEMRGHLAETVAWLDRAAPLADSASAGARAFALFGGSVSWYRRGDYDRSAALCEESLALWREVGDRLNVARALNGLGNIAFDRGEHARSRAFHEEALALRRELGQPTAIGASLVNLGILLYDMGDYAASRDLFAEAFELRTRVNDLDGLGFALNGLGVTAHRLGDLAAAHEHLEAAIALRRGQDSGSLAASLVNLAAVVRDSGDPARAIELYRESATLRWERGERKGVAEAIAGLAIVAATGGQPDVAVRLFAAADALSGALGAPLSAPERPFRERALTAARAELGRDAFAAAWEAGRALSIDEAVLLAAEVGRVAAPVEPVLTEVPGGLSPRELEVLRLVADGLTDAEVGARLYISPRTVARHLYSVYQKLDVNSRTAAVAFAFKHGLA